MRTAIRRQLRLLAATVAATSVPGIAAAGVDISQTPLMVAEPIAPNILFVLDDSGSMGWEHMPGTTANWHNSPVGGLPKTVSINDVRLRASNINTQWYNPLLRYEPWLDKDGLPWPNADYNGSVAADPSKKSGTGTLNFKTSFTSWPTLSTSGTYSVGNTQTLSTSTGLVSSSYQWRYSGFYFLTGASATSVTSYTRFEFMYGCASGNSCNNSQKAWRARRVSLKSTGVDNSASTLSAFDWTPYGGVKRSIEEELQNYANWFSYYRLRITMAKAAASRVFAKLGTGYRVGYNTIHNRQDYKIPVARDNGAFTGQNKAGWFDALFNSISNSGTPLHKALDRAGQYFSDSSSSGPYGPGGGGAQLSCRQNFTILTTDGYWNDTAGLSKGVLADHDSTPGEKITGVGDREYTYTPTAPFTDGNSGTLADVAMYYWKNDLRTNLTNNVPTSAKNPAFWQHMRTYGISIGEQGTLTPDQATLDQIKAGKLSWPKPANDKQENIDDLWHAAVNSRGEFIVASNPDEFARALTNTLNEIASETKYEASGAVNSATISSDSRTFFSRYTSGSWTGDVLAFPIDPETGLQDQTTPAWEAETALPAWAARNIKVNANGLTDLRYANLTAAQKAILSSDAMVDYLRGDRSKEVSRPGGSLRERAGLLPAFINSQLIYVGDPSLSAHYAKFSFNGASSYASYAAAAKGRTPMLYVAGNNGMLHGFDASTGVEKFAFLPNFSISTRLANYLHPDYGSNASTLKPHEYILDGEVAVADVYMSTGWRTVLVATQGRGGTGVFALDVTDPSNITLLWERTAANNNALGNNIGKPLIAQVANGDWRVVLGNGPNSSGDRSQLIMIRIADGSISAVDTGAGNNNGLSAPSLWDDDKDGIFETAYAGDLAGNIWRFTDLGGTPAADLLFSTPGTQPVSAAPLLVSNQKTGDLWVFFGTGSYLNREDLADNSQQAWYGLIDDGTTVSSIGKLLQRHVTASSQDGAVIETGTESDILQSPSGQNRGWYINFTRTGERMLMTPNYILGGALFGFTFVPVTLDPCEPNGSSSLWGINPFTGARLNQAIFLDDNGNAIKVGGEHASVLYGIPVVTTGSPPITIQPDDGKFAIHLPSKSIKGQIPMGEPSRQSWREAVGQ